jgi:ABC-type glycerol-3-phosphate transport system substrate-binding protein
MTDSMITRRDALKAGAVGLGALSLAACGSSSSASSGGAAASNSKTPVTLNMLTWNDHYDPQNQLPAIKKETG